MPDDRPLKEKLEAMADQDESPVEAEIARALLRRLLGIPEAGDERVLTRSQMLDTPDREGIKGPQRVQTKDGRWYTIDLDEMTIDIRPVLDDLT